MKRILMFVVMMMSFASHARMGGVLSARDIKVTIFNDSERRLRVDATGQNPFSLKPHERHTFSQKAISGRGINISLKLAMDNAATTYVASVGKDKDAVTVRVKYDIKKKEIKASTK